MYPKNKRHVFQSVSSWHFCAFMFVIMENCTVKTQHCSITSDIVTDNLSSISFLFFKGNSCLSTSDMCVCVCICKTVRGCVCEREAVGGCQRWRGRERPSMPNKCSSGCSTQQGVTNTAPEGRAPDRLEPQLGSRWQIFIRSTCRTPTRGQRQVQRSTSFSSPPPPPHSAPEETEY